MPPASAAALDAGAGERHGGECGGDERAGLRWGEFAFSCRGYAAGARRVTRQRDANARGGDGLPHSAGPWSCARRRRRAARRLPSRTDAATCSWASRNGTPCRTSASAASVASSSGSAAAAARRSRSSSRPADEGRERTERAREVGAGREDGRLVLLQVAVVGERQPLDRREQAGQAADRGAGLAARELGDVRVQLLRHHRRAGGGVLAAAGRSRTPPSSRARAPRRSGRGGRSTRRPRRGSRARSRGRRRRRASCAAAAPARAAAASTPRARRRRAGSARRRPLPRRSASGRARASRPRRADGGRR